MADANVLEPDFDANDDRAGFVRRRAALAKQAGASELGLSLHELPPGGTAYPYHFHYGNEELMVVLSGRPTLRTPAGSEELAPGDVVAHVRGPDGPHQVTNRSSDPVRFLMLSEMEDPEVVVYPDSDKIGARSEAPGPLRQSELWKTFRAGDAVDYFDGESPPSG
jgi:uncharacterized cupin superfamily protein